jgi:DNA-binding NarL/FixJ family response regulator
LFLCTTKVNNMSDLMNGLRILVADSNVAYTERLKDLLINTEFIGHLAVAVGYDETLKTLNQFEPNVVLMDINLPLAKGIQLIKLICQHHSSCKVIVITNLTDNQYRQQCIAAGAAHFLDKTNEFEMIPGIIADYISDTFDYNEN